MIPVILSLISATTLIFFSIACKCKLSIFAHFMRRHIHTARDFVLPIIDIFYPPFKKMMGLQTFRYAASGGINTAFGYILFYIAFKFIFRARPVDLGFYVFEAHSAALLVSFLFCFPFGFFLMKYVVFSDSKMKGRVQLVRYFAVYLFN